MVRFGSVCLGLVRESTVVHKVIRLYTVVSRWCCRFGFSITDAAWESEWQHNSKRPIVGKVKAPSLSGGGATRLGPSKRCGMVHQKLRRNSGRTYSLSAHSSNPALAGWRPTEVGQIRMILLPDVAAISQ